MANKWVHSVLSNNNTVNIIRFVEQIHEFTLQNIRVTLALYLQKCKASPVQNKYHTNAILFIYLFLWEKRLLQYPVKKHHKTSSASHLGKTVSYQSSTGYSPAHLTQIYFTYRAAFSLNKVWISNVDFPQRPLA